MVNVYAGTTTSLTKLPSPVSVMPTRETIWSEDTGRAQSGSNKAEMIGTAIAEKMTYAIKWGILTLTEFNTIVNNMPKGFFYFHVGSSSTSSPNKYYRSEIAYEIITAGGVNYYKDVSVSAIQK